MSLFRIVKIGTLLGLSSMVHQGLAHAVVWGTPARLENSVYTSSILHVDDFSSQGQRITAEIWGWAENSGGYDVIEINYEPAIVNSQGITKYKETHSWNASGAGTYTSTWWGAQAPDPLSDSSTVFPGLPNAREFCNVIDIQVFNPSSGETTSSIYSRTASTTIKINTGGAPGSTFNNVFGINATASSKYDRRHNVVWGYSGYYAPGSANVPPNNIKIRGKTVGSDNVAWVALPDNSIIDVTPEVSGHDFYYFSIGATKYESRIKVNSSELNNQPGQSMPQYSVGRKINASLSMNPNLSQLTLATGNWATDANVVTHSTQVNSDASRNYSFDSSRFNGKSAIFFWPVRGSGQKNISVDATLQFDNGQSVNIDVVGYWNLRRPTASQPVTPTLGLPSWASVNPLVKLASSGGIGIIVRVDSPLSGRVNVIQLVKRTAVTDYPGDGNASTNGEYWLDNTNPYNVGDDEFVSSGGFVMEDIVDDPKYGFINNLSVRDDFKTYFVFKPDGIDSIWVTLARYDWHWFFYGGTSNNTKELKIDGSNLSSSEMPEWANTYENP